MSDLVAALASNRRKRNTAAAARYPAMETPKEVAVRRSERISSISKPDGLQTQTQDPDLSQNLLDDDGAQAPARALIFSPSRTTNNNDGDGSSEEDNGDDSDDDEDPNWKKRRLSVLNEDSGSSASTGTPKTAVSSKSPGGHGFPKRGDNESSVLQCAARDLCKQQHQNDTLLRVDDSCICINCNFTAHLQCADNLFVQRPKKDGAVDYHSKLSCEGKGRVAKFKGDKDNIMICMSCMISIELSIKSTRKQGAPKKAKKSTFEVAVKRIIVELRNLALFQCLVFIYTKKAQTSNKNKVKMLQELYYGTVETKGMAEQVIDGDGPFARLYEMVEGPNGEERVLKFMYCGTDGNLSLVIGRHIKLIDLTHFSGGTKTLAGSTLWKHGADTVKLCKKAMMLVVELAPQMVQIDGCKRIVGYASGMSVMSFLQALNYGMYVLRDDEEFVRTANRNDDSGDMEDMNICDEPTMTRANSAVWDPFDGGEAPDGWIFTGYTTFALLGPACEDPLHFSLLLKSNADANQSKEVRKEQSRAAQRKRSSGREADVERQERHRNAITMQTNCDIATIALANQEAREHALDRTLPNSTNI